jgi:hypothetical protein
VKNKLVTASAVLVFLSAFLFAPVREVAASVAYSGMSIFNSVINSTPVGMTTPAAGNFLGLSATSVTAGSVQASGSPAVPLATQGAYLGWSRNGLGEADFFAQNGTGVGGFAWFNTGAATQLMSLNQAGVLTVATVDANLNGNVTGSLIGNGTGTWNGPVNGNASSATVAASTTGNSATATLAASATQLANSSPSQCATGATGIQPNGNANCISSTFKVVGIQIGPSNVQGGAFCATLAQANANCTSTINWPSGDTFADGSYGISCNPVSFTGAIVTVELSNFTGTTFQVTIFTGGDGADIQVSSLSQLSCTAIHP